MWLNQKGTRKRAIRLLQSCSDFTVCVLIEIDVLLWFTDEAANWSMQNFLCHWFYVKE